MLFSAVSVLVVAQSSSEIPEGLMNNPVCICMGHTVAQLVKALRYKSEGRGFDSLWSHWNLLLI